MDTWLLHKYIGIISSRLERFKRKGPNLYNFRCIFCGDSEQNKNKARGYIFEKQGKMMYHCHNCGAGCSVPKFIKTIDQNVYNEMMLEYYSEENRKPSEQETEYKNFTKKTKGKTEFKTNQLKGLKKISQLPDNNPVRQFVTKRKIPESYYGKLYDCPNFMEFVNSLIPKKFDNNALRHDEQRLLIPFFDENRNLHALQGRSLISGKSKTKYITIILNEDTPKIYGLDGVKLDQTVYVFEGPIDSMFIPNSIAVAGGDLISVSKDFDPSKMVFVYDNEPRSKETISKLDKSIMHGYKVCIWPDHIEQKDINDMVLAGLSPSYIKDIIDKNTFSGLAAKLSLAEWRKRRTTN